MNREEKLSMVIRAQEIMDKRGCLIEVGKAYLSGLKEAQSIAFPLEVKG